MLFSVIFSSNSLADWKFIFDNNQLYHFIDFARAKVIDGHVYFWSLTDRDKPTTMGDYSTTQYIQVDCKFFKYKILNTTFYKHHMALGKPSWTSKKPDESWSFPPPKSSREKMLIEACKFNK